MQKSANTDLTKLQTMNGWNGQKKANLGRDKMFGYAGIKGFSNPTDRLIERTSSIFTHNNVIKRHVIAQRWIPFLEANRGAVERKANNLSKK